MKITTFIGLVLTYLWLSHRLWPRKVVSDAPKPILRTRIVILGGGFGGLYSALHFEKERGRIVVNETLEVPGVPGVWAVGDCTWVPNTNPDKPHPPTAQHALREAVHCAKNVEAAIRGSEKKPFRFSTLGQLATIGHRAGVADILGLRVSGFLAWWLWRTIYLAKLPTLEKKLRVALRWTLDFAFPRDLTQHVTLHGIDRVSRLLAYVRQHPVIARPVK